MLSGTGLRARGMQLVALAASLFLVAGCAQIPYKSPAQAGPQISTEDGFDYVYYNPQPPEIGQSPSQVINGFLSAGTGPQNDYSVARQYLSQSFRTEWNPSDEVLVQSGLPSIELEGEDSARVEVEVLASVDSEGNYTSYSKPERKTFNFALVRENGSWKIADAPHLTMLMRPVFDVLFSAYALYYFDNSRQYLVPDLRWYPARASTGTRMVNSLLAGSAGWLRDAASTPMPKGTKLAIDSVTVSQSIAIVNLDSKALNASATQLRQFKAQLVATLTQLPNVDDVQLLIDGNVRSGQEFVPSQPSQETASPVVLVDQKLRFGNQESTSQLQSAQALVRRTNAHDFAVRASRREIALLGDNGLVWAKLGQIDNNLKVLDTRPRLLSPVFDHSDRIWSMSRDEDSDLLLIARDGSQTVIPAAWLHGFEKVSFAVSPEGSRIAVVVKKGAKSSVLLASIIRDQGGWPVALGEPINATLSEFTPSSVSWSGLSHIVVLYSSPKVDGSLPYRTEIGGNSISLGSTAEAKQILGTTGGNNIFLLGKNKSLYAYSGYTWNLVTENVVAAHLAE